MNKQLSSEIRELLEAVHYRPAVSIILPFEPKMSVKSELVQKLKSATDRVEKEIRQNYTDDLAQVVIQKLRDIIRNLNFSTYKKSIAIYVSPVFEKVLYLDIPVEERVIVDESFEIRDLVYAKKDIHKYLVVVLSSKRCKVFIGNTSSFIKIKSNVPDHVAAYVHDAPEKVANFSDQADRKEMMLEKFLEHSDKGLSYLLQVHHLPVFVLGTKKVIGTFKKITKNEKSINGYVFGNYEDASEKELENVLKPFVNDWKKVKMKDLCQQLEEAAGAGKLIIGIEDVWKYGMQHKGRLLVVEKNYVYPAEHGSTEDIIIHAPRNYNKFSYIKDAVDDIIEKVLEYGGDVEFVDEGVLKDQQRIALVTYY